ncbi:MAG TPA: NAD(P)-binding domain-containing protein, partial [Nonomuraea sp.]|nr:NAD(P)-binding domain-containing protein [Nonomuraea sp.]
MADVSVRHWVHRRLRHACGRIGMTDIAFIGLGIMGSPMAVHLVGAGHRVAGYNRSPAKAKALGEAGGRVAASIADAVAGAEVVALMVPDTPDVQAVLAGDGGVFAHAAPGTLIIDFSTIRPDATRELADEAARRGLRYLDAPVSGGEAGARAATLSIMVGGEPDVYARAEPLLAHYARAVTLMGGPGSGQLTKM